MNFSSICRTCLDTEYLSPIFKNMEDHSRYTTAVYIATGLKVELNDGLPQQICKICIKRLNDTLNFRKQCKDVEVQLLNIKNGGGNQEIDTKDVKVVYTISSKRKMSKDGADYQLSTNIKTESHSDHYDTKPLCLNNQYENIKTKRQIKKDFNNDANDTDMYKKEDFETDNFEKKYIAGEEEDDKYEEEYLEYSSELDNENLSINEEGIEDTKEDFNDSNDEIEDTKDDIEDTDDEIEDSKDDIEDTDDDIDDIKEDITSSPEPESDKLKNKDNFPYIKLNSKRVKCKFCNSNLSKGSIYAHLATQHPGADTRKAKCDMCDRYISPERMKFHKIHMHGSDGKICGYCKTECDSKALLIEHVKTCPAKNRRRDLNAQEKRSAIRLECDICHKMIQKVWMKHHKRITHAGLGPACEHCGRRFASNFRLGEHLRAKHGYEKFKCSMCDFRSATILSMRNHERRHRGEKPFVCETCGSKFHTYYLLYNHKRIHSSRRDKKCDKCPATFKGSNTLHMHKLACHTSRIYQCPMCPRTYSCRHYALKHLRSIHRYSGPIGDCKVGEEDKQSTLCIAYIDKDEDDKGKEED